ncbi:purine/pyrimidine permease [Paludifilum halophilum]|uniref:Xanthine permease n=1 Tax=Paludifilum halophilum TaxID=1642702 RepID=A0A235B4Q9_9BACL|nr:purine/pyrimidine permease [Paludifilum halophilum]OYD07221.1 xanthine permease [Paludifilum halophilum]
MKRETGNTAFGSLQWFVFMVSNVVAMPIVIGEIYRLPEPEVADLMQRAFFIIGVTSLLQGWFGHRLPIADGPAGIWLGVFVIMGDAAVRQGSDLGMTLRSLESGMLMTGMLLALLGLTGFLRRMIALFTPLVTGVYLLLLVFQLSGVFLQGMLGIRGDPPRLDGWTTLLSFGVMLLVILLSVKGKGWMKNYSILIGIGVGWSAFGIMGLSPTPPQTDSWFRLPEVFAWGPPLLDPGMLLSGVLIAVVLLSNIVASVAAVDQVVHGKDRVDRRSLDRGGLFNGVGNMLAAVFSSVGMVPLSNSAGFIQVIHQRRMRPYRIAGVMLVAVSLVPVLTTFLAGLPSPVTYAVLLASFTQIVGIGVRNVVDGPLDQRRMTILGTSLMIGVGLLFVPPEVFRTFPSVVQLITSNGLLVGTVVAMLMERVWGKNPHRLNSAGIDDGRA